MPSVNLHSASLLIELMKLTRDCWMTKPQITTALAVNHNTVRRWVREMTDNGLLREAQGQRNPRHNIGRTPKIYSLIPAWGGQAAAPAGQGGGNGNG